MIFVCVTVNLSDSQSNCPVGHQARVRGLGQLLLGAADPSAQSLGAVRFGALVRAAAAAGGREQPGTGLGEPRPGGGKQQQHQYHTPRQQRDANAGRKHCPSAGSHLSCTPASSHPISPPWSAQRRGARGEKICFKCRMNGKLQRSSAQQWTHISRSFQKYSAPWSFPSVPLCHGSQGAQLPVVQINPGVC